jgi:16S rRNA processing protein RimM
VSARIGGEAVGRVGRPHGLDGSFYVEQPERPLEVGEELLVAGQVRRIERRAGTDARPIVRLSAVAGREAAAALRGEPLRLTAEAPHPAAGELPVDELVGCRVPGIGEVRRVLAAPSCDLLEVGDDAVLVPLVSDAVLRIDPGAGVIEVDLRFLGLEGENGREPSAPEDFSGAPIPAGSERA